MSSSCRGIFQTSNEDETLRVNPESTCGWEQVWIVEDVVWEENVGVTLRFRPRMSGIKVMQGGVVTVYQWRWRLLEWVFVILFVMQLDCRDLI